MPTDSSTQTAAPGTTSGPRPGLRERNKARTRKAIRTAAMDLFEQQGYTATTVAQIADAADVSHTTFFRYFQSKEQVVLQDDIEDAERLALLEAIEPGLDRFALIRRIISDLYCLGENDEWASNPARFRLIKTEPGLLMAQQAESDTIIATTIGFISDYLGVPSDDLRLRVFMAAVTGVMFHVVDQSGITEVPTLEECLEAIGLLEAGLPV
ncbi:TetR family transcriptional regulator [Gordonia spumicola]|uniref:TetR family transcriptional regulator n=1 Tax=Gordonia spumicola TaxID=589161 RepID=A0A7I9V6W5_9ACTN|nr:TetR family transcriptional regulator [Gordonia spumicola]GEE00823.1 TetR family transcriptional regulator [Gordonia spumicola]